MRNQLPMEFNGWNDYLFFMDTGKIAGANLPTWGAYRDGLFAYEFSASALNELWGAFHILHDYSIGTAIYPHIHWSPDNTSTGTVRWGFEYSIAKVNDDFGSTTTIYFEEVVASASQYQHFLTEATDAQAAAITAEEPDTMIQFRVFRDGGHANDTFSGTVHGLMIDLHYQSNRFNTVGKRAPFNRPD